MRETPSAQGTVTKMRFLHNWFFQNWWERAPSYVRVVLVVASIVGMVLGGSASGYWD